MGGARRDSRLRATGFDSIPPEWLGTYFRWWGVYTQGDGAGVVGGKGGEGKALPCFMLRIRIPNGILNSSQLRAIAELTQRHARGIADLTVRQNVQLHWVTIEALPEILEALWQCGLNTMGACGDVTRNVTGCPVAGVDADEICDASPLALAATQMLRGQSRLLQPASKVQNLDHGLPCLVRLSGDQRCWFDCDHAHSRRKTETGFSLRVAGGLSAEPHLAARLNGFVRWNQVEPVIKGIAEIFRDQRVPRKSRAGAAQISLPSAWLDRRDFQNEVERRIGFRSGTAVD